MWRSKVAYGLFLALAIGCGGTSSTDISSSDDTSEEDDSASGDDDDDDQGDGNTSSKHDAGKADAGKRDGGKADAGKTVSGSDAGRATSGRDAGTGSSESSAKSDAGSKPDAGALLPGLIPGLTGAGTGTSTGMSPVPVASDKGCGQSLPSVTDYGANGPFQPIAVSDTGPSNSFTMWRPATLGDNGFKHPIVTWGNGITTTPDLYPGLLGAIASHGFVLIASNSVTVTSDDLVQGLDWIIQQNDLPGDFQGKLNTTCLVTVGYSLGGGAAVEAGTHDNVVATVSLHGVTGFGTLHGPLLLISSEMDDFVTPDGFVQPTFDLSNVQTFYGMYAGADDAGHLTPIFDAGPERAPTIAWLRLWVYGDQGAKQYFYGDDCILCKDPWTNPQRKNWN